jgi:alpha 1,2-mannosyltransferase
MREIFSTIPTSWRTTRDWIDERKHSMVKDHIWNAFMTNEAEYNSCHFWTNFEIASFDVWRHLEYEEYIDALDKWRVFHELWGDAPVHSLAVAMFLNRSEIRYFHDFGYSHEPHTRCQTMASKNPLMQKRCQFFFR